MNVTVKMNPSPEVFDTLKKDITWAREELLALSTALDAQSGRAFKLSVIGEVQKIYDKGRDQKRFQEMRFPRLQFDESNRRFSLTFFMAAYPLDLSMDIELRRRSGQWRVREL